MRRRSPPNTVNRKADGLSSLLQLVVVQFEMAALTLRDLVRSLRTTVDGVLEDFLQRCQNERVSSAAVEIRAMFDTTLEAASSFTESVILPRDEEESRVEEVRRSQRFHPVTLGEAVDVEVAAWHSAICGKMKLQRVHSVTLSDREFHGTSSNPCGKHFGRDPSVKRSRLRDSSSLRCVAFKVYSSVKAGPPLI